MFGMFQKPRIIQTQSRKRSQPAAREALCAELARAAARGEIERERELLVELQMLEPGEPRWSHRLGDLYRKAGSETEAAAAYRAAATLYADKGFEDRALAMTRVARMLSDRSRPLTFVHNSIRP